MVKPTWDFYHTLNKLASQDDGIGEDVTNFHGNELGVEVVYYEARHCTKLHPITGKAPFWHPLNNRCAAKVGDIWAIQAELDRKTRM